ncbi:hypothetical protein NL676_023490 [Syzygium grande]|nr:hypothetical protein NL676_023490 [Syzygium grande]
MKRLFAKTSPTSVSAVAGSFTEDLIIEILSGLPVKSLMRFKCVSKKRIVKSSPLETIDYEQLDDGTGGDHSSAMVRFHEPTVGDPSWMPDLVGSCDGLVCFVVPGGFLLYNPTTKESRNVPDSDLVPGIESFHGFGYDPASDDYKIVQGGEEKFHQVLSVPEVGGGIVFEGLGIHGANLFIYHGTNNDLCEAWITNEYQRGGLWTKLFSVSTEGIPGCKYWLIPIACTRSGKIVFQIDVYRIILFNPEENTYMVYPIQGYDSIESAIYVETLVSPYLGRPHAYLPFRNLIHSLSSPLFAAASAKTAISIAAGLYTSLPPCQRAPRLCLLPLAASSITSSKPKIRDLRLGLP